MAKTSCNCVSVSLPRIHEDRTNASPSSRSLAAPRRLRNAFQRVQKHSFLPCEIGDQTLSVSAYASDPQLEVDFRCAIDDMRKAGVSARLIYATIKLGRVITVDSFVQMSAQEIAVWNDALETYDAELLSHRLLIE